MATKSKEDSSMDSALALLPEDALSKIKGVQGGTVRATEEESTEAETIKQVVKKEGDKHIVQKGHKTQKEDCKKTAEASLKTTNEGGVKRTVQTTKFTTTSSYEEETIHQTTSSGPIMKSIK